MYLLKFDKKKLNVCTTLFSENSMVSNHINVSNFIWTVELRNKKVSTTGMIFLDGSHFKLQMDRKWSPLRKSCLLSRAAL